MNINKVHVARREARAFLKKTDVFLKKHGCDATACGSKESGTVRRQSMELTNSLIELRKAG